MSRKEPNEKKTTDRNQQSKDPAGKPEQKLTSQQIPDNQRQRPGKKESAQNMDTGKKNPSQQARFNTPDQQNKRDTTSSDTWQRKKEETKQNEKVADSSQSEMEEDGDRNISDPVNNANRENILWEENDTAGKDKKNTARSGKRPDQPFLDTDL